MRARTWDKISYYELLTKFQQVKLKNIKLFPYQVIFTISDDWKSVIHLCFGLTFQRLSWIHLQINTMLWAYLCNNGLTILCNDLTLWYAMGPSQECLYTENLSYIIHVGFISNTWCSHFNKILHKIWRLFFKVFYYKSIILTKARLKVLTE